MQLVLSFIDQIGAKVLFNLKYTFQVLMMAYVAFRTTIFEQSQGLRTVFSVVATQIYFTGWQAVPLISVLAVASGAVVILQSQTQLSFLGGQEMIGNLLVVIVVRELGPLMTALIVIARSGTAVASEVGNMRANREIEALEVLGINPLSYIVFPRMLGGVVSVLCLAFYFNVAALFGGFFVTKLLQDMPLSFYFNSLAQAIEFEDVILFLVKNTFSGVIIFIVSCFQGLSVKRAITEVPIVTTQAVVNSIIYVVVFNMSVTALFYLNKITKMGLL
jgi:phospholipid/cholesterol/gamma-HCH transport system permease protein